MTDDRPDSSAAKRALDKFKQLESQVSKMELWQPPLHVLESLLTPSFVLSFITAIRTAPNQQMWPVKLGGYKVDVWQMLPCTLYSLMKETLHLAHAVAGVRPEGRTRCPACGHGAEKCQPAGEGTAALWAHPACTLQPGCSCALITVLGYQSCAR